MSLKSVLYYQASATESPPGLEIPPKKPFFTQFYLNVKFKYKKNQKIITKKFEMSNFDTYIRFLVFLSLNELQYEFLLQHSIFV
jgi:hypothetical protein